MAPTRRPQHTHILRATGDHAKTLKPCGSGTLASGEKRQKKSGEAPCQTQRGLGVRLVRHLAGDLRKHVVRIGANQFDRANHDHQDYCKHHRVFGDVLTALFSPKLTDCFDHTCFDHCSPQSTTAQLDSCLRADSRRCVIVKYPEPGFHPIAPQCPVWHYRAISQ